MCLIKPAIQKQTWEVPRKEETQHHSNESDPFPNLPSVEGQYLVHFICKSIQKVKMNEVVILASRIT